MLTADLAGSLAFMFVFGTMSYLAFRERDREGVSAAPPLVGMIGSFGAFPILRYNLYTNQPGVFGAVVLTGVVVAVIEIIYFGHNTIWAGIERGGFAVGTFAAGPQSALSDPDETSTEPEANTGKDWPWKFEAAFGRSFHQMRTSPEFVGRETKQLRFERERIDRAAEGHSATFDRVVE